MNWNISKDNWVDLKSKVKAQWSKLTEENLNTIAGQRVTLAGKLRDLYGITENQANKQIKHFEKKNKNNIF